MPLRVFTGSITTMYKNMDTTDIIGLILHRFFGFGS